MRFVPIVVLVLLVGPAFASESTTDDCAPGGEAGGTPETAARIQHRSFCSGWNEGGGDWYYFDSPAANASVAVEVDAQIGSDLRGCIRGPDLAILRCGYEFTTQTVSAGRHYLTIEDGWAERYAFVFYLTQQNDCQSGRDAPPTREGAVNGTPNVRCQGQFPDWSDTVDWFQWYVPHASSMKLVLSSGAAAENRACVHRPSGPLIVCSSAAYDETFVSQEYGWFAVEVSANRPYYTGAYITNLSWTPTPDNDCASGADAGNLPANATNLSRSQGCEGGITYVHDADWYAVPVAAGEVARVLLRTPAAGLACVVDETGTSHPCGAAHVRTATSAGHLRFRVENATFGAYTFDVDARAESDCGEPRDASLADPVVRPAGTCSAAFLLPEDVEDAYAIDVPASRVLRIQLPDATSSMRACLVRPDGSQRACTADGDRSPLAVDAEPGRWLVRVESAPSPELRSYTLALALLAPDDCGAARDASPAAPVAIAAPRTCRGALLSVDDLEDAYGATAPAGHVLVLQARQPFSGMRACLADACAASGTTTPVAVPAPATARIVRDASGERAYEFSLTSRAHDDCGSGADLGAASSAPRLAPFTCSGALLARGDDADAYVFDVAGPTELELTLTGAFGLGLCLDGPGVARCGGPFLGETLTPGRWTARVTGAPTDAARDYTLAAALRTNAPDCGAARDTARFTPLTVSLPLACWGTLGGADVEDAYRLALNAGARIVANATSATGAPVPVCLRDEAGALACGGATLDAVAPQDGVYQLVPRADGAPLAYAMAARATLPGDCTRAEDAGTGGGAIRLGGSAVCEGQLAVGSDSVDEYLIEARNAIVLRVAAAEQLDGASLRVCTVSPSGTEGCADWLAHEAPRYGLGRGTWRIRVEATGLPDTQRYTLDVRSV